VGKEGRPGSRRAKGGKGSSRQHEAKTAPDKRDKREQSCHGERVLEATGDGAEPAESF
jgi:hypothetical protein